MISSDNLPAHPGSLVTPITPPVCHATSLQGLAEIILPTLFDLFSPPEPRKVIFQRMSNNEVPL